MKKMKTEKLVTVTINVTAADIKKGWDKTHSKECPIALACKRIFKKSADIYVLIDGLEYGESNYIDLPAMAEKFSTAQVDQDDTFKPKPFSFKLRVPQRLVK